MPETFYQDKLYPYQDKVLKAIETLDLDFYLTGGTALSRCYLNHRYSEDLDFFVNSHPEFKSQSKALIDLLKKSKWHCDISTTSASFVRVFLEDGPMTMKIDLINDVPFHYGEIEKCPMFHRVDNWRNILSNKICALSRLEVKDIVDILFIAKEYPFDWEDIVREGKEKDLWVEPIEISKILSEFPVEMLYQIKWVKEQNIGELKALIKIVHDDIFFGRINSLAS